MTKRAYSRAWLFAAGDQAINRHPGDLLRLALGSMGLVVSAVLARRGSVGRLEADIFRLVNDLPNALAVPLMIIMQVGAYPAVLVVAGLALLTRRLHLARDLAAAGTLAYVLAKLVKVVIVRDRPGVLLDLVLVRGMEAAGLGFPSGHVAVASALATAAAPYLSKWARRVTWGVVALVAVARLYVGAHLPIDVLGGAALGWAVGAAVHLFWGSPGRRTSPLEIQQALETSGLGPVAVVPASVDARGSMPFFVKAAHGSDLFVKTVGREQRDADWLFKAWRFLLFREVEDEAPFATPKQQIEHEAYVALLAEKAGVRTPGVVLATTLSDGAGLLVQQRVTARGLDSFAAPEIDDALLAGIWNQVKLLRNARIAHRDLRRANILVDAQDQPWIIDFGFSEAAASERRLAQDIAEMLASLACLVGPERATASALTTLGPEAVEKALPLLQPLALGSATRQEVRAHPGVLEAVREQVTTRTGAPAPPVIPLTRVRLRTVLALAGAAFAIHLLLPQVGEVRQTLEALRSVRWEWVMAGAVGSAITYVMAAVALMGAVEPPLAFGRTIAVQLAGSFINRLTPQGVGGIGVNERYLEHAGVARPAAVAAVAMTMLAGGIVHFLSLSVALALVGRRGVEEVHIPEGWPVLIAVVTVLALLGAVLWTPFGRRKVVAPAINAGRNLAHVVRRPTRAAQLFGGSAGITGAYALTLVVSLYAYGVDISPLPIIAVYLGGAAVASVSPTPGGLGAIEAALVAGLTAFGVPVGPAVAGVLTFRLLTFWLPILPGFLAYRYLRHRNLL